MATWMNEAEIDDALGIYNERAAALYPYARFLSEWRHTINANSDGWPYWRAGSRCAAKLSDAIQAGLAAMREGRAMPAESLYRAGLAPIRSCATKHKLPAPELWSVPK